jgi:hypothetical protein
MAQHGRSYTARVLTRRPIPAIDPGITGNYLTWTAAEGFVEGYRIYRGASAGSLTAVLDVGPTPTEVAFASIPGATIGQWFAVSAFNPLGESALTTARQWVAAGAASTMLVMERGRMRRVHGRVFGRVN